MTYPPMGKQPQSRVRRSIAMEEVKVEDNALREHVLYPNTTPSCVI